MSPNSTSCLTPEEWALARERRELELFQSLRARLSMGFYDVKALAVCALEEATCVGACDRGGLAGGGMENLASPVGWRERR